MYIGRVLGLGPGFFYTSDGFGLVWLGPVVKF